MNLYEGMYIFPEGMDEEAIEEGLKGVGKEIERLGGNVKSTARLGKRKFARPLDKMDYGYYAVMTFELEGHNVEPLEKRFKLMDELFRVQIVHAEDEDIEVKQSEEKEEKTDG